MEIYSIPYCLLLLCFLALHLYESRSALKNRDIVRKCSLFLFVFFFGCRGYIGTDWFNYSNYYKEASLEVWTKTDYEIGFAFVAKVFNDIGISYNYFVLFITCFQVYLWDRFLQSTKQKIALSYIVLISIFPLLIIDLLRNFTAILIALQGVSYFLKNKNKKAILYILLSMTFHTTGIFFFLLFLLRERYFNKKVIVVILLGGLIVYFLQIRFIENTILYIGHSFGGRIQYLAESAASTEKSYGIRLGILEKLLFAAIVLAKYKYITQRKIISPLFFNSFFVYIFILLYFSTIDAFVNRFSLLFFWSYVYVLAECYIYLNNNRSRKVVISIILLICFVKSNITFNNVLYDYSNFIFTKDSLNQRELIRMKYYYLD